jgi:hypothetical protein
MSPYLFRPRLSVVPILALLGTVGLAAHVLAQQNPAPPGMQVGPEKTGAGPRGTPDVGPSTNPGTIVNPASPPPSTTGVPGTRGTKIGPTTTPGAPTETPQQTR